MGWRFFRRIRIVPGLTLNLSKSGVSVSVGPRGAKYTVGPRGKRLTLGLPGTGLFYTVTDKCSSGITDADRKAVAEAKASIKANMEEINRLCATLESDNDTCQESHAPPPEGRLELGFLERRRLPRPEVALVDAFVAIRDGDNGKALQFAREATAEPDGALLASLLSIQAGHERDAKEYLSFALKNSGSLGSIFKKYNPPFLMTLPVANGIDLHLFELSTETALVFAAALAEEKGNYKDAVELVKKALRYTENPEILRIYYVKLLSKESPQSKETREEIRWLRRTLRNKRLSDGGNTDILRKLHDGITEILSDHNSRLKRLRAIPTPASKKFEEFPSTSLIEILQNACFENVSGLFFLVGIDNLRKPIFVDFQNNHNMILVGQTGSGKTTIIHGIILSSIWHYSPNKLQILMADSRLIELSSYKDLPHLIDSIASDPNRLIDYLESLLSEAKNRINFLAKMKSRSITEYNRKHLGAPEEQLSHIVMVIDNLDEFFHLPQQNKLIVSLLSRISDLSRTCGIHLVVSVSPLALPLIDVTNFQGRIVIGANYNFDSESTVKNIMSIAGISDEDISSINDYWIKQEAN
jgi:DNA segregation ATPase FtsK/SpoIIIE-like protein